MADISLVAGYGERLEALNGVSSDRGSARPAPVADMATQPRPSDRVDISDRARFLNKLVALPEIRADLVQRIRGEIEAGSYDTDSRLDEAIKSLAEDLEC